MHLPGSVINNRYQVIQQLGRSEKEKTYLAKDLQAQADARCVVEQLSFNCENELNWQIIQQYLLKEVSILDRLGDHPQIPQFYDHFMLEQQFYLVREYIDGDNLEQEVKYNQFDEADTIFLLQDGLRILDFIHKTNVIHRDVQPAHLIRRQQDNAYVLINFGAIREIEATEINLQGELILNNSVSNWVYAAPEQREEESYFSSDIYALARTAVYALTGRSPLELERTDIDWRSQCQISSRLEAILSKMMLPTVDQRYHSALEVLEDLRPLLMIKQTVGGRYLIRNYLGGGEGIETYVADNLRRQYQSPCLIKRIELAPNSDFDHIQLKSNFAEEMSVLERLGYHEQIPQLWDHFEEDNCFYLVQEYVQGISLAEKIAESRLSTAQIMQILDSTLSVLEFIHQNRIIHRNLKPSNLLIRELDRQIIVTDFGILNEIANSSSRSPDNQSWSKQNYWSPEQIAGRPTIGSDLYSLGMMAIEAATGQKPATLDRDSLGKLLWTTDLNLNRRSVKIIDKLVQLDLSQRYQSAEKALSEIRKTDNYGDSKRSFVNIRFPRLKKPATNRSPLPLIVGVLGIFCLLGSIEYAFPTIRPIYYEKQGQRLLPEQPKSALDRFARAIDLKADSWRAWFGRGESLTILKRYSQALEAYRSATALKPDLADNWQKQGDVLFLLERFTEAIAAYNQALELESENPELYNHKGRALFQLQQYEAALVMQEAALAKDRLNPQFLSDRAENLLRLGRYESALGVFNRVQAIEPNNLKLWQNKLLVLEALNRPQETVRLSEEINNKYIALIQQQPQNTAIWIAQGDFLATAKMLTKAIESYESAIQLEPNNYQAWLRKSQILVQQGKLESALTTLSQTLQLRPTSYLALQLRGRVYQQQQNYLQAIADYDRAIEISPNYPNLWRDRGIALNKQGNFTQAIDSLTQASELSPYDLTTWQELVKALQALGRDEQILTVLDRALKYYPQSAELWSQKGLVYTANGQYNEACDTYRQSRQAIKTTSTTILNSMRQLGCRLN
ncbi:MAG: tetratricopeptide repeat protein [Cyanobacteria bacterium J06600_6]